MPRFGHTRPDDGTCCNQGYVVVATQFLQQTAHGRTFDVKTTDGLPRFQLLFSLSDRLKILHLVNIDLTVPVSQYDLHTLLIWPIPR